MVEDSFRHRLIRALLAEPNRTVAELVAELGAKPESVKHELRRFRRFSLAEVSDESNRWRLTPLGTADARARIAEAEQDVREEDLAIAAHLRDGELYESQLVLATGSPPSRVRNVMQRLTELGLIDSDLRWGQAASGKGGSILRMYRLTPSGTERVGQQSPLAPGPELTPLAAAVLLGCADGVGERGQTLADLAIQVRRYLGSAPRGPAISNELRRLVKLGLIRLWTEEAYHSTGAKSKLYRWSLTADGVAEAARQSRAQPAETNDGELIVFGLARPDFRQSDVVRLLPQRWTLSADMAPTEIAAVLRSAATTLSRTTAARGRLRLVEQIRHEADWLATTAQQVARNSAFEISGLTIPPPPALRSQDWDPEGNFRVVVGALGETPIPPLEWIAQESNRQADQRPRAALTQRLFAPTLDWALAENRREPADGATGLRLARAHQRSWKYRADQVPEPTPAARWQTTIWQGVPHRLASPVGQEASVLDGVTEPVVRGLVENALTPHRDGTPLTNAEARERIAGLAARSWRAALGPDPAPSELERLVTEAEEWMSAGGNHRTFAIMLNRALRAERSTGRRQQAAIDLFHRSARQLSPRQAL